MSDMRQYRPLGNAVPAGRNWRRVLPGGVRVFTSPSAEHTASLVTIYTDRNGRLTTAPPESIIPERQGKERS